MMDNLYSLYDIRVRDCIMVFSIYIFFHHWTTLRENIIIYIRWLSLPDAVAVAYIIKNARTRGIYIYVVYRILYTTVFGHSPIF